MGKIKGKFLMAWLLVLLGAATAFASCPGDYNPGNPPEPNAMFKITTATEDNAYTSGDGWYSQGSEISIGTSSYNENYQFGYWLKNGQRYTDEQWFTYRVEENAEFKAVYIFKPVDPAEPTAPDRYRLFLKADRTDCCSFNMTSGTKTTAGEYVWVCVYPSQGYRFKGWFLEGKKLSDSESFYFFMPTETTTLTARFVYAPSNPEEPNGTGQSDLANTSLGDINNDGLVNTADAVELIGLFVDGKTDNLSSNVADMNGDGIINTTDAILLINNYVNGY